MDFQQNILQCSHLFAQKQNSFNINITNTVKILNSIYPIIRTSWPQCNELSEDFKITDPDQIASGLGAVSSGCVCLGLSVRNKENDSMRWRAKLTNNDYD